MQVSPPRAGAPARASRAPWEKAPQRKVPGKRPGNGRGGPLIPMEDDAAVFGGF